MMGWKIFLGGLTSCTDEGRHEHMAGILNQKEIIIEEISSIKNELSLQDRQTKGSEVLD